MSRFLLVIAFFLSGCAALPLESPHIAHPSSRFRAVIDDGYRQVTGVIHIHTIYSDGQLPVEAIAKIANRQNLDFLILTDHNTLKPKADHKEGWYRRTLVLAGDEISTQSGHYVALNIHEEIPSRKDPQWTINEVAGQGGLGFIAHPFWRSSQWKNLQVHGFTGLEIYNAAEDVSQHRRTGQVLLGLGTVFFGQDFFMEKWLSRCQDSLALWDRYLNEGKRIVGIGSADAHGLKRLGLHLGPYGATFKLVRDHLLIPGELTQEALYQAIAQGHLFMAHDIVADATGFQFVAVQDAVVKAVMGDQVKRQTGLKLEAYLPSPGKILLLKDGKPLKETQGQHLQLDVENAGIYRVEATKKGRPWIYSNPIYVIE